MKTKFNDIKNLSVPEILDGISHCLNNSNELFESAIILKKSSKFSTAISLLILSIEELMKSFALLNLMILEVEEREIFREIFDSNDMHSKRHNFALFFNEFYKAINAEELMKLEKEEAHSEEGVTDLLKERINIKTIITNIDSEKSTANNWFSQANTYKNRGFYVAYNKKWFSPNSVTEKEFITALKETELIRNIMTKLLNLVLLTNEDDIYVRIESAKIISDNFKVIYNKQLES